MWGCASQLWVPGMSCVHRRPYLSFCPMTLQHFSFRSQVLMSMQMDAEYRKEQIGTLFVWMGALEGFFWGVESPSRVSTLKSKRAFQIKISTLLVYTYIYGLYAVYIYIYIYIYVYKNPIYSPGQSYKFCFKPLNIILKRLRRWCHKRMCV
jgi:hypothetical protein